MPLTLSAVLAGPLFRLAACLMWPENYIARIWLPFACLDTLGIGAFLAFVSDPSSHHARWKQPAILCGLLAGGPLLTISLAGYAIGRLPRGVDAVLLRTVMGWFFLWLTAKAAVGFKGWFGRVLGSRPLGYVGKISYGIYVIHFFVPQLTA